jgi:hypothetical protein
MKANILCHASGWCPNSQMAFKTYQSKNGIAIRFDGDSFSYNTEIEEMKLISKEVIKQNKQFFEILYSSNNDGFDVPEEFTITETPSQSTKKSILEGFDPKTFLLKQLKSQHGLTTGCWTLIYRSDCQHLSMYLPIWNEFETFMKDYRLNMYTFKKEIYSSTNPLLKGVGELPVVIFEPKNKLI